jgi:DNA-binding CsgD family transcriptional regulator
MMPDNSALWYARHDDRDGTGRRQSGTNETSRSMPEPNAEGDALGVARERETPDFYVVDDTLRVLFRSRAANADDGRVLTDAIAAVVERLIQRLQVCDEPNTIGVLSDTTIVRLLRLDTHDGQPRYAAFLEHFAMRNSVEKAAARFKLSARESEVLARLMSGDSTAEIARHLAIAATTVHEHVRNIGRKTKVTKRSEIVATVFGLR